MSVPLPAVRAELAERFIFNFRMPADALARFLPAPWLRPQTVRGFGVASFCLLDLRRITVAPLPTRAGGLRSVSCAPRFAVLDGDTPAVFVTERQTSSAFGAWFTSLGFSCAHPYSEAAVTHRAGGTRLRVRRPRHAFRFDADVRPADSLRSELWASAADFGAFIAQGVSSFGRSRYPGLLTEVSLHKDDFGYEPLDVAQLDGPLLDEWRAAGAVFDSAFRTAGGRYQWAYHGLRAIEA